MGSRMSHQDAITNTLVLAHPLRDRRALRGAHEAAVAHARDLYAVSLVRLGVVIASPQTNLALPHRRGCPWRQDPACLDPRRCRLRTGARAVTRRPPVLPAIGRGTTGSRGSEPRGR